MIPTTNGVSTVAEIRSVADAAHPCLDIRARDSFVHGETFRFLEVLVAALIQQELDARWWPADLKRSSGRLLVVSSRRPVPTPGSELFPPLFAVPYQAPADVAGDYWCGGMAFLNANHALCRWLFANAAVLSEDFAAVFERVFRAGPSQWTSPDTVNTALDQVARARPAIAPPPGAYLKAAPNGQWVSR